VLLDLTISLAYVINSKLSGSLKFSPNRAEEEKHVNKRLFFWVANCYAAIIIFGAWEALVLSKFAWDSANLVANSSISWLVRPTFCGSVILGLFAECYLLWVHREQAERLEQKQKSDAALIPRRRLVERIVADQCLQRQMSIPKVVFLDKNETGSRTMVGMLHMPFATDSLMLHADVPGLITEKQLAGVVAHELRHSGAWENYLSSLSRLLTASNIVLIPLMLILSVGVALFDPKMPFFGTIWAFIHHLLWLPIYIGVAMVSSMARSRWTEFKTDALAVADIGDAKGLIGALNQIHQVMFWEVPVLKKALANQSLLRSLMSTHPAKDVRTEKLKQIFLAP